MERKELLDGTPNITVSAKPAVGRAAPPRQRDGRCSDQHPTTFFVHSGVNKPPALQVEASFWHFPFRIGADYDGRTGKRAHSHGPITICSVCGLACLILDRYSPLVTNFPYST